MLNIGTDVSLDLHAGHICILCACVQLSALPNTVVLLLSQLEV